jgi:DNA polymerase-3 subunit gamma/tau
MSESATPYRVLARKYRPQTLSEVIGQDALVRTVRNAFRTGRIAHAFLLTGVRGVGKTTTARIIARGLNCIGPDGKGEPTPEPCGQCQPCQAILQDRHVDIIEMDAASRTGVENMRELIEGVRYRPVSARYKVYIIDEVHMLSGSAFNALLKTLEEPPPHVKFIFATTEVRKLPVTVLSRCQRFDLRRVDSATLIAHFERLVAAEGVSVSPGAMAQIARAADGSVRDGLSLLDQAIAHGSGQVDDAMVGDMLCLADRVQVFDLFETLLKGDAGAALDLIARQYAAGVDPLAVLNELLELCHWLTRIKMVPSGADDPAVPEAERTRGRALASRLSVPALSRAWQILLKGAGDARAAPNALQATEMALVRLAYAANLPTPAEALAALGPSGGPRLQPDPVDPSAPAGGGAPGTSNGGQPTASGSESGARARAERASPQAAPQASRALAPEALFEPNPAATPAFPKLRTFADLVALAAERREALLHSLLVNDCHVVHFEPGRIEIRPSPAAASRLPNLLAQRLKEWTGERWGVAVSAEPGGPTMAEAAEEKRAAARRKLAENPLVKAALEAFPGATIGALRPARRPVNTAGTDLPTDETEPGEPDS